MQEATGTDAVADFTRLVLDGTGWEVGRVRKRASRLEPPHAYWVIHEVTINKEGEERKLRLVARGAFDSGAWDLLRELGCDIGQGYYLGRPVSADELLERFALASAA